MNEEIQKGSKGSKRMCILLKGELFRHSLHKHLFASLIFLHAENHGIYACLILKKMKVWFFLPFCVACFLLKALSLLLSLSLSKWGKPNQDTKVHMRYSNQELVFFFFCSLRMLVTIIFVLIAYPLGFALSKLFLHL